MGLSISLIRRHSLEGLAEGWTSECFLRVEATTAAEVKEWNVAGLTEMQGEESFAKLRDVMKKKVVSGQVLSTKEDDTTEIVAFTKADVDDVLDALPIGTFSEILETSLGLAKKSSAA